MLAVRPLHPLVGAEVTGLDLTRPLDDGTFAAVERAFLRHGVLAFPGQPVDDAQQIAFSRRFGELEATKVSTIGSGTPLVHLSSTGSDGRAVPKDDRQDFRNAANRLWHSDSSFKEVPAKASLLSARVVPPEGGETEYVDMRAVYRELDAPTRARIDGLVAWHAYSHSRSKVDPALITSEERSTLPPVRQRVVRLHPSGEKALYLGSHASHIDGWPEAEGRALIEELLAFATQDRFVYTHRWREGDLVLWDNRACIHRGRPFDKARHSRYMVRTTVAGECPSLAERAA